MWISGTSYGYGMEVFQSIQKLRVSIVYTTRYWYYFIEKKKYEYSNIHDIGRNL